MSEAMNRSSGIKPIESFHLGGCNFVHDEYGDMVLCHPNVSRTPSRSDYRAVVEEQRKLIAFFDEHRQEISRVFKDAKAQCEDAMDALRAFMNPEKDFYTSWMDIVGETYTIPVDAGAKEYLIKVVDIRDDGELDEMEIIRVDSERIPVKQETLIKVSGGDFHPIFRGLIEFAGYSCSLSLLEDLLDQSMPLEAFDASGNNPSLEVPKDEKGFVGSLPPLKEDIGSAPRFESESRLADPLCMEPQITDPGFELHLPPLPEGIGPVPMPSHEDLISSPELDPCFNPCSPECLNR